MPKPVATSAADWNGSVELLQMLKGEGTDLLETDSRSAGMAQAILQQRGGFGHGGVVAGIGLWV